MAAVLALLRDDRDDGGTRSQMAAAQAALALGVDGICAELDAKSAGLVLIWGRDSISVGLDDLQFTLGQGPALEASAGRMALVPDVDTAAARWPAFVPAAVDLGVRAVFALPLRIGASSAGALVAHRAAVGPLSDAAVSDAFALADTLAFLLTRLAPSLRTDDRIAVHHATGMVSVQLGVSLAEASVLLRAYAYAQGHAIAQVAADVVARRVRFGEHDR